MDVFGGGKDVLGRRMDEVWWINEWMGLVDKWVCLVDE